MAAMRLRVTFAAMALSARGAQAVNGSDEVARTDGFNALNGSVTSQNANASAPPVAEFIGDWLVDTWAECDVKCGVKDYFAAMQAQMSDFQAQDAASHVREMTERAFEASFAVTCGFRDVLKCVASNKDICSPQVPGDGVLNDFVNSALDSAFGHLNVVAAADEADCLCDACPGIQRAIAGYHGAIAEAAAEHTMARGPLDEFPSQLKNAALEGVCPMFGALSCMESEPTCRSLSQAVQQGQEAFDDWAPKFLVEEAEQTKASCTAAGVSMALETGGHGGGSSFLSGSAPSTAMAALSIVVATLVLRS